MSKVIPAKLAGAGAPFALAGAPFAGAGAPSVSVGVRDIVGKVVVIELRVSFYRCRPVIELSFVLESQC